MLHIHMYHHEQRSIESFFLSYAAVLCSDVSSVGTWRDKSGVFVSNVGFDSKKNW